MKLVVLALSILITLLSGPALAEEVDVAEVHEKYTAYSRISRGADKLIKGALDARDSHMLKLLDEIRNEAGQKAKELRQQIDEFQAKKAREFKKKQAERDKIIEEERKQVE